MADLVETRIDRVIVHPGAAQIVRTGELAVAAPRQVRVAGLPAGLDDDSVQIAMTGPGRAVDLRVVVDVVRPAEATTRDADVLAARRQAAAVAAERAAVTAALAAQRGLGPVAPAARDDVRPAWGDVVAARLALVEVARDRGAALRVELAELERRHDEAQQALAAAEERLRRRSSAELPPGAITKAVIVTVVPDGDGGPCTLRCTYRVDGARWAPTYVARLDDGAVRLELRAAIAQATGEDWSQVAIELSTATPGRRVELPELAALRIGRAQPRPARAGWRPPPIGVEELYRDWDRAFADVPRPPPKPAPAKPAPSAAAPPEPMTTTARTLVSNAPARDEGAGSYRQAPAAAPMGEAAAPGAAFGGAPPAPQGAQPPRPDLAPARKSRGGGGPPKTMMMASRSLSMPPPGGSDEPAPADDDDVIVARVDLLAFAQLTLAGPRDAGRGTLQRQGDDRRWGTAPETVQQLHRHVGRAARRIETLGLPPGLRAPAPGVYDYAFASDGRLDVPGDGAWHQVAVVARTAPVVVTHVVAPAVAPEVYRVATLTNPLDAPLLAGPVDVYERGELVITAALDETPPGGAVAIGLGVDPVVKTARNARYREEAAGVLRGSLRLVHDVTVDVENLGARKIDLEVRERVPVPAPDGDDVEVAIDRVVPTWEPWRPEPRPGEPALKGGYRWRVALAAGERQALRVEYAIKIAGKHELVGGNRREP